MDRVRCTLDPWFSAYQIPADSAAYSQGLQAAFFTRPAPDGSQGFTPEGRALGLIPQVYRHDADWRNEDPLHRHLFLELIFVVEGEGLFQEGARSFPLKAGDLLLLNHFCRHQIQEARRGFVYFDLRFDPVVLDRSLEQNPSTELLRSFRLLQPFFLAPEGQTPRLALPRETSRRLMIRCLQIVHRFLEDPAPRSDPQGDLRSLLETISLEHAAPGSPADARGLLPRALSWLSEHFTDEVDLVTLARHLGVSRTMLSTSWNREVGLSLPKFVTRLRTERAKELLRLSEFPIHRIAIECGFNSDSYFINAFRKAAGVSPGDYRDQVLRKSAAMPGKRKKGSPRRA